MADQPVVFPVTVDSATRRCANELPTVRPVPVLAVTDRITLSRVSALPENELTTKPEAPLLAATLSTTVASIVPVLNVPITLMPEVLLLYASTRSRATRTVPERDGWTRTPIPPLSATSVVDIESLPLALGTKSMPTPV